MIALGLPMILTIKFLVRVTNRQNGMNVNCCVQYLPKIIFMILTRDR